MGVSDADVRTVWCKKLRIFLKFMLCRGGEKKGQFFFYRRPLTEEVWVLH